MKLSVLAVCLVICYFPMLAMTVQTVALSDDMAHGLFAPIVAIYVAWSKRGDLLNPAGKPGAMALPCLAAGALIGTVAALANSSTFSRFGFLVSLAGCLLLIGGSSTLKRFIFPVGLLLFTFPIPDVMYGELTQPLQLVATGFSEVILEVLGFSVLREGNLLRLPHMSLSVVEACSGLRSLITLVFFCVVYAYFFESRLWLRLAIVSLAIPAAIAINALRISATGVLGSFNLAWTGGIVHEIVGWTAFALGFLLVFAAHRVLNGLLSPRTPKGQPDAV